jgi:hypothetical protein
LEIVSAILSALRGNPPGVTSNAIPIDSVASEEGRTNIRTHLFVLATLYTSSSSGAVHIRNMSSTGALVEGAGLPEAGTMVTVKRGRLQASGQVVWRQDRRAGINFSSYLHVSEWMSRQVSAPQLQVDQAISAIRSDFRASETETRNADLSIEAELAQLKDELSRLGNSLIGDIVLVATHPEIQTLDISLQRIDRITEGLQGKGRVAANL